MADGATLKEALGGGEDYELLIVLGEADAVSLVDGWRAAGLRRPVRIGSVLEDPGVRLLAGRTLERLGWQHRLG